MRRDGHMGKPPGLEKRSGNQGRRDQGQTTALALLMGYEIYREVLEFAPADLRPSELVVLLVIADYANKDTRMAYPGMELLAQRARLKPDTVSKVLKSLAARGVELRVPRGTDSRGKTIFAHKGQQTTYRVPVFSRADDHPAIESKGRTTVLPIRADDDPSNGVKGRTVIRQRSDDHPSKAGLSSHPSPQEPSKNPERPTAPAVRAGDSHDFVPSTYTGYNGQPVDQCGYEDCGRPLKAHGSLKAGRR